jgi:serine protease Do
MNTKEKKKKKKKEKKPVTMGRVVRTCTAFLLVTVLINAGVTYAALRLNVGNYVTSADYKKSASIQSTQSIINEKLQDSSEVVAANTSSTGTLTVSDIADAVLPSVVSITSTSIYQSSSNPFMYGGTYQVSGAGSGIIIGTNDTELLIATNNHVVEDTTSLTIEFVDGTSVEAAYVKGTSSSNDIAVVAVKLSDISDETSKEIKIATLGDSDELSVGDQVVAIGNALGYGQSVTVGYVSALNRELTVENATIENAIQTDASINGGNSGGALINMKGEVVGINFAKLSSSSYSSSSASIEGMGYAIPISEVKDILSELMNREPKVEVDSDDKGYIGITSALSIDSTTSSMYNIPEGAYLKGIAEGSPADKAGIQLGDVIVAVDGEEISSYDELQEEMKYHAAGDTITITVERAKGNQYQEQDIEVTLCSYDELEAMIDK